MGNNILQKVLIKATLLAICIKIETNPQCNSTADQVLSKQFYDLIAVIKHKLQSIISKQSVLQYSTQDTCSILSPLRMRPSIAAILLGLT